MIEPSVPIIPNVYGKAGGELSARLAVFIPYHENRPPAADKGGPKEEP